MKTKFYLLISILVFQSQIAVAQCFSKIKSGFNHVVAQKPDGSLWVWGWGNWGQLNNIDQSDLYLPTRYTTGTNWQSFNAGTKNTFAIKTDGTLWGSGGNTSGSLGINSTANASFTIVQVGTANNWKQIAAGGDFTFGIKTDNTLWGWGMNDLYQMGDGTCCTNRLIPGQIGTATDWKQVAACSAASSILALKNNGTMWGWGSNASGLLAPSNVSVRNVPTQLNAATDWASITTGGAHALALKTNGTLWAWGSNTNGQVGDSLPFMYFRDTPVQVGTATWLMVFAGSLSSWGIQSDGTLWAWGRNDTSQLGDGTTTDRHQPFQIGTDTDWISVTGGFYHAVALKSNGALYAWGDNYYGQLGNGTDIGATTPQYTPVAGCTLGVAEFEQQTVEVFPNPARDEISINYLGTEFVTGLAIYDSTGRMVYKTSVVLGTTLQATLPVNSLQSGIYIIGLLANGKTVAAKRFSKY